MLKRIVSGTVLPFLLIGILTLAFNIQPVKASGTIHIRADGSIDPPTAPITTVDNVTYTFTGNVNDSIVVERDNIIVDGQGYTVQGTGSGEGIYLSGRSNVTIKNMEIKTFSSGILLYDSSNNSIWGNNITANSYDGILLLSSGNNTISENNITANSMYGLRFFSSLNNIARRNNVANNWYGIYLEEESSNNTFRDNNMTGNKFSFHVSSWSLSGYIQDVDVSNTVDGKPVYYWISKQDMVVPANPGYVALVNCTRIAVENLNPKGVLLAYTADSIITNNDMANNGYGVYLAFSSNNNILENNITNNEYGIWFDFPSSNNVVSKNNITASNFSDIWLSGSSNNTISGNNVNNGKGILLRDSYDNSIYANNMTNNEYGIVLWYSSTNRVYRNSIRNSRSGGVLLTYSSNNNLSENKVIASNNEGIWLEFSSENTISGNYLENNKWGIHLWYSSNNEIYHNNFVHNTKQVWIEESIDVWDGGYPSGGSYWSDYVGVDVKSGLNQDLPESDGIGDTPYIIDADNQDRYPLMRPWTLMPTVYTFSIVWEEETFTVSVESNSTVSNLAFNQPNKEISFYATGPDGTIGFCNVTIPKQLLYGGPWSVLIDGISVTPTIAENETHSILYFTYIHSTHKVQIIGAHVIAPPPPPLSASISPLSSSILVGQSVTFTSTVSGGYTPYAYQWYLDGAPVSEATSNTWAFTPATSGIYYVHLKVTDAKANTAQSETAHIPVAAVPVGGYSFPIHVQTKAEPIIPYIALTTILTATFIKVKRKTKRER